MKAVEQEVQDEPVALVPLGQAAFDTGTARTVAGYDVYGNAGVVGRTYNVNIWGLYRNPDSRGMDALIGALRDEASAAGASRISISGNWISNPDITNLNPAIAARWGLSLTVVNPKQIILEGPVQ